MSSKSQRLNATITIGSVLEASVKRNVGFLKTGLSEVGNSIKDVERRQKELDRQRHVLRKQGESVAHLDREYEDLERTLDKLRRSQERWNRAAAASRRVGSTFGAMASDIGRNSRRIAIGATLAGGAVFGLAASTAELGDNVAKTADKLGIDIEALQELRYAAERSGVATSAFDTSLEKMTKNLGLALEGTGAQKDALDALGLSAADLVSKSPEEALGIIADKLQGVETQAEKAAIASDLFGRSGIGMLNMLRGGSEGLVQLRKDAQRTGYVLSEQAARDAEVFQDTLLDTQLALKGIKNTVGAELMPVVTNAMGQIGDTLIANREGVQEWAENFADGVERVLPAVGEFMTGIGEIGSIVWGVIDGTAEMVGGWENFGMVIGAVLASRTIVRVGKFGAAVLGLGKSLIMLTRATPLVVGGIRAIGTALLMNPIGIAVAGIAGAAYLIYQKWEHIAPWFADLWGGVETTFGGFADFVGGVFTGDVQRAASGIETMWDGTKEVLRTTLRGIGNVFRWSYNSLIKPITDKLGITDDIEAAWTFLQGTIGSVIGGIGGAFDAAWINTLKPVIDGLSSTDGISKAWERVKSALDPLLTWVGNKFETAMTFIRPVIDALKWGLENAQAAGNAIGDIVGRNDNRSVMDNPAAVADAEAKRQSGQPTGMDRIRGSIPPATRLPSTLDQFRPQKNALGGPFRPGWHLTGELGPELKFENRSGYVANNRAMRQLADYADRASSLLARPTAPAQRAGAVIERAARAKMARAQAAKSKATPNPAVEARVNALFSVESNAAKTAATAPATVTQHIEYTIHAAGASAEEVIRLIERKSRQAAGGGLFDRAPSTGPFGR